MLVYVIHSSFQSPSREQLPHQPVQENGEVQHELVVLYVEVVKHLIDAYKKKNVL